MALSRCIFELLATETCREITVLLKTQRTPRHDQLVTLFLESRLKLSECEEERRRMAKGVFIPGS
jgi:hypothetical protein